MTIHFPANIQIEADVFFGSGNAAPVVNISKHEDGITYGFAIQYFGMINNSPKFEVKLHLPERTFTIGYNGSNLFRTHVSSGLVCIVEQDFENNSSKRFVNPKKDGVYESKEEALAEETRAPVINTPQSKPMLPITSHIAPVVEMGRVFVPADGKKVTSIIYSENEVFLYVTPDGDRNKADIYCATQRKQEFVKCEAKQTGFGGMMGQMYWEIKIPGTPTTHKLAFVQNIIPGYVCDPVIKFDQKELGILFM